MILVIDNYDSFTYNLVQILGELNSDFRMRVVRNDEVSLEDVCRWRPKGIVISPGPGYPKEAGITISAIRAFAAKVPILGVCLGHQAIAEAFGGEVVQCGEIMHGKTSSIFHDQRGVFRNLDVPFAATRYHSLMVRKETLPSSFKISAQTSNGIIMGIRHREFPVEGIQFHPESILTRNGRNLLENFLAIVHERTEEKGEGK